MVDNRRLFGWSFKSCPIGIFCAASGGAAVNANVADGQIWASRLKDVASGQRVNLESGIEMDSVVGYQTSRRRTSHTTADGSLRMSPIDGVSYRFSRPVSHHHGHLTEVFRSDWGVTDSPIGQVTMTTTFPGIVRAWGIHQVTVDRLFAATGSLLIVCFDGRTSSPTFGYVNEFMLGGRNQGLVVIPPGVYHGWKNIGDDEATIISMPSQVYDYENPDRWELLWDSPDAIDTIPYDWP